VKEESTETEDVGVAEESIDDQSHASSERARPNRTQAERIDRELARFTEGDATIGGGFDADGNVATDGTDDEADALARRFPTLPGVAFNRTTRKPILRQPPRGTPGWASKGDIHPRRRTYKAHAAERSGWGTALRPSMEDAPTLVGKLLGARRITILRTALRKRGATKVEREARVYLAVVLDEIDHVNAQRATALALLGSADENAMRVVREVRARLRRGEYPPELVEKARGEFRSALGRLRAQKQRMPLT